MNTNIDNNVESDELVGKPASELGEKIKELREAKGWTPEELAAKCPVKISGSTVRRIENGQSDPQVNTVSALFRTLYYGIDFDFTEIPDPSKLRKFRVKGY